MNGSRLIDEYRYRGMSSLPAKRFFRSTRQIRETVGPEHIDVYRSVLSLLRECAEEGDPVKLFHRLKRLLGEKWPQLIDEFVPFLQPEQVQSSLYAIRFGCFQLFSLLFTLFVYDGIKNSVGL